MPTEKKQSSKTQTATKQTQPKQRHRRTMAELLQDPKYRAAKGLAPLPGTEDAVPPEKKDGKARENAEKQPVAEVPEKELSPAVEAEERKFFEKTTYSMSKKAATPCFKRMYPGSWCFEIWDTQAEECVASYRLPSSVVDENDAFEYVKKYCNRHMAEVANRNVVVFEVHREFRVEVSQIETVE